MSVNYKPMTPKIRKRMNTILQNPRRPTWSALNKKHRPRSVKKSQAKHQDVFTTKDPTSDYSGPIVPRPPPPAHRRHQFVAEWARPKKSPKSAMKTKKKNAGKRRRRRRRTRRTRRKRRTRRRKRRPRRRRRTRRRRRR